MQRQRLDFNKSKLIPQTTNYRFLVTCEKYQRGNWNYSRIKMNQVVQRGLSPSRRVISYQFVIHTPTFCFVTFYRVCVTSLSAQLRVRLTSARLSPTSAVKGLQKYLIVFVYFLCLAGRDEGRESEGVEDNRDRQQRGANKNQEKEMRKRKGQGGSEKEMPSLWRYN